MCVGTAVGTTPEEYDGGLALSTDGKDGAEVGISGHHDPVFSRCQCKHLLVGSRLHTKVAQVDGIVSGSAQSGRNAGRDGVVHKEPQEATLIGISRSRTLSAAWWRACSMCCGCRSGKASMMSAGAMPSAIMSMTVANGMRRRRRSAAASHSLPFCLSASRAAGTRVREAVGSQGVDVQGVEPVSYTHLTLPTNREV